MVRVGSKFECIVKSDSSSTNRLKNRHDDGLSVLLNPILLLQVVVDKWKEEV